MLSGRSDFGEVSKRRISISTKVRSCRTSWDLGGIVLNGEIMIMLLQDL